jgi:hypothetical protein
MFPSPSCLDARGRLWPIVTEPEAGCDGRNGTAHGFVRTNDAIADGEVVWSGHPRCRCQVARSSPRDDGGKKARSPVRARRTPLKPLRREAGCFRLICGDSRLLFCSTLAMAATSTRLCLRPLRCRGRRVMHNAGAGALREGLRANSGDPHHFSPVIARESRQSSTP